MITNELEGLLEEIDVFLLKEEKDIDRATFFVEKLEKYGGELATYNIKKIHDLYYNKGEFGCGCAVCWRQVKSDCGIKK